MPMSSMRARGLASTAGFVAVFLLAGIWPASPAVAQAPGTMQHIRELVNRRIESIDPAYGPPGTRVTVVTRGMPSRTPIRLGAGSIGTGFEAFQELLTTDEGELEAELSVPAWARWDEPLLFIVFDIYFRPIALSDAFHATRDGLIRRQGVVQAASPGCFRLDAPSGISHALTGELVVGIQAGDEIIVEGVPRAGACGLQNAIQVVRIIPGN